MHIPDGLAAILVVFHDVDGVDLFPCTDVRLVRKRLEMRGLRLLREEGYP
jgi:hypothetical protein